MAVNLNALAEVQTVGSNQNMLLFGDNNVATRIDYDKLANAILDKLTSKTYSGINNNVISAIRANASDIAVLDGRMDDFTKLPDGSTTGDAELIDGRIGYDGTTYTNIGTAIRSQISDLHDTIGDNISASNVGYDGSGSGLVATNVQAAIDEIVSAMDTPSGDTVPAEVKNAIYILLSKAAYIETGLSDELEVVEAWTATTLTVTNRLTRCTTSNTAATVESRSRYSATLTANSGYILNNVKVTMGGVDITSTAYSSGTITIPSVTGNIVITATAVRAVSSITATYTQSGTVYDTAVLDDLKSDLVVTATYSDSSTAVVPSTDYTLSGTLSIGTSTITVSHGGKTTTFDVVVSEDTHGIITDITWTKGALSSSGGINTADPNESYTTDYIPMTAGQTISFSSKDPTWTAKNTSGSGNTWITCVFYKTNSSGSYTYIYPRLTYDQETSSYSFDSSSSTYAATVAARISISNIADETARNNIVVRVV